MTENTPTIEWYADNQTVIPIYIQTFFSVRGSIRSIVTFLSLLCLKKRPDMLFLNRNVLPFSRCIHIRRINEIILISSMHIASVRCPPCVVFWINAPEMYVLHNYVRWTHVVFDYTASSTWEEENFKKHVLPKKLVFVYTMGPTGHNPSLFAVHKTAKSYRYAIWRHTGIGHRDAVSY